MEVVADRLYYSSRSKGQVVRFVIFLKFASRLVPDGWVELKMSDGRCYFWTFQLELDILDTKNIEIGSVGTKLQLFETWAV